MCRLMAEDYAVDAVTMAKALVGAWLCRRLDDGTVIRRHIIETEAYCNTMGSHSNESRSNGSFRILSAPVFYFKMTCILHIIPYLLAGNATEKILCYSRGNLIPIVFLQ